MSAAAHDFIGQLATKPIDGIALIATPQAARLAELLADRDVTTVARESASRSCRYSRSANARPKERPGFVTSFMPMQLVIRSGSIASAWGN